MYLSEIYCRGYSGEDPPLPIPNREVKLTIADGTDPPVGRVGSRGSSKPRASRDARGFFCILSRHSLHCHFERSREIFSVIPRPCPAPAAIEPSFHGLSVESALRHSGSMMLLLQFRLESAETERHRGLDEPTSPFTSRGARNVGGQCSSCRFASPPPARGPRTFPFPHTSPHRSSNRRSPPLWPATPSVPAWLPSCCGGRVATKSPGKRAFPPIYRGGRPPFSHHSRRKYLPFPSCPIRSGIGNASSQVVLRNAAGLQKSFDLLRYMLLYGRFASQVGRKMQTCVTSPPNLLHFAT